MTSLKSLMNRRSSQVLDLRDMKNLKGGKGKVKGATDDQSKNGGGGYPPDPDDM